MVLFLVLLAWLSLLRQQAGPAPQSGSAFTISGTVVNSISGAPISQAEIGLHPLFGGPQPQSAVSDASGHFAFSNVLPGRYTLNASRRGFVTQFYLQHGPYSTAVVADAEFDTSNLILRLPPEGSISGQVLDESGDPVRGVQVTLFGQNSSNGEPGVHFQRQTSADDEGRYHFAHLIAGTYFVAVSAQPWYARHPQTFATANPQGAGPTIQNSFRQMRKRGNPDPRLDVAYPVTFFPNATEIASASPIQLSTADRQTADITLTAVPARHVRLNFSADPKQYPNVSLRQELFDQLPSQQHVEVVQIEPGVWELLGIPPGHFELVLSTFDQENRTQLIKTVSLGSDVEISAGAAPTGVEVRGKLMGEAGHRPARMRILLLSATLRRQLSADVTPQGEFEFREKVSPGTYTLVVAGGDAHFLTQLTATGAKVSGRTVEISAQDVQLTATVSNAFSRVSGFALRDGKRTPGMLIALVPQESERYGNPVRFDQSDGDGSFSVANLLPGKYMLIALDKAWDLDWNNVQFLGKFTSGGEAVTAEGHQEYKFDAKVQDATRSTAH